MDNGRRLRNVQQCNGTEASRWVARGDINMGARRGHSADKTRAHTQRGTEPCGRAQTHAE